jgi:hypothetical protein
MTNYLRAFQHYDAARKDPKTKELASEIKRQIISNAMEAEELLQRARDVLCTQLSADSPIISDINAFLKKG